MSVYPVIEINISSFLILVRVLLAFSFVILALILYHGIFSAILIRANSDLILAFQFTPAAIIPYLYFFFDNLLFGLTVFSMIMLTKFINYFYMSSRINNVFFWIIISSLSANCVFLLLNTYAIIIQSVYKFSHYFLETMIEYAKGMNEELLDSIHLKYQCCGVYSFKDWLTMQANGDSLLFNSTVIFPPSSCCANQRKVPCIKEEQKTDLINLDEKNQTIFWKNGCLVAFQNYNEQFVQLGLSGIALSVLSLLYVLVQRLVQTGDSVPRVNFTYRCWIIGKAPLRRGRSTYISHRKFVAKYRNASVDALFQPDPRDEEYKNERQLQMKIVKITKL